MLSAIGSWFVINSIGFWVISLLWIMILISFVDSEKGFQSTVSLCLYLLIIWACNGSINIFETIKTNGWTYAGFFGVYVVLGIIWSILKTYYSTKKIANKIQKIKTKYVFTPNDNKSTTKEVQFKQHIYMHLNANDTDIAKNGIARSSIVLWIAYWPFSAFWTLLNDPVRHFCAYIYDTFLIGIFKNIHKHTIGKAIDIK